MAGNIGSGETTLITMLAKRYNWVPQLELMDDDPYLDDFYADMTQWPFGLQIYSLNKRLGNIVAISKGHDTIIQDRTILKDTCIFAPNLHSMGMMSDRDSDNYADLSNPMMSLAKLPDLLIYIRSGTPNPVSHAQERSREFERSIRTGYLQGFNTPYKNQISAYKGSLVTVDGDRLHFKGNSQDFKEIADMIDDRLCGLFPLGAK